MEYMQARVADMLNERNAAHNHPHVHGDHDYHHHHSHAASSKHGSGHHLLQVQDLSISFSMYDDTQPGIKQFFTAKKREHKVIDKLSISVHEGELVAVVGASGSGKSLLADAIMGMFEPNALVSGEIWFDGEQQTPQSLAALRGRGISFVPQSVEALDPLMKVGRQVWEQGAGKGTRSAAELAARKGRQEQLFERYGFEASVAELYPHQLSGGMARRVLLCCALIDAPQLIIADEPTPGLDLALAIQAVEDLRQFASSGGGVMLITHDLELALRVADRIAVFKDGTVVEETSVEAFGQGILAHPFSQALYAAMPTAQESEAGCRWKL